MTSSPAVSTERTLWTNPHPNLVPSERYECGQTAVCPRPQGRVPRTSSREFTKGRRLSPFVRRPAQGHKIEKSTGTVLFSSFQIKRAICNWKIFNIFAKTFVIPHVLCYNISVCRFHPRRQAFSECTPLRGRTIIPRPPVHSPASGEDNSCTHPSRS